MAKSKKPTKKIEQAKPPKAGLKPIKPNIKYFTLLVFIGLAFILYFQGLLFGYVLDDKIVITDNTYTKNGLAGLWDILTTESMQGYFGEQKNILEGGRYRPLSIITFAIEHQFFGLNSAVSHHINALLYGLCGFVSFIGLRRLFLEKTYANKVLVSLSFLASILFILHPIHTEAVANIKGRDEILAFLFSMLTLLLALKYFDQKNIKYLLGMAGVFFLGLLSKENTITFLAIVPFGIILFRKKNLKKVGLVTGVLFITVLAYLLLRYQVIGFLFNSTVSNDIMNNPFVGMNGVEKFSTIMYTLLVYLKLNVFPHPLTHDYYPYHIPKMNLEDIMVWLSIGLHIVLIIIAILFWKKRPKITFAIGFYIAAMSIISNLVVSVGTFMNERFAFTASLGTCILIAYLGQVITKKFFHNNKKILTGMLGVVGLLFALKTFSRVPVWENVLTLNTAAVKVSKNSARANSFMATALFEEYKITKDATEQENLLNLAQPYMTKALNIYPSYFNGNLMRAGIAAEKYKLNNDLDALLSEFLEVVKQRPDVNYVTEYLNYLNTRADLETLTQFYRDAGHELIIRTQNVDWAIHYLLMGNEINPSDEEIKSLLVQGYTLVGRLNDAAKFQ